MLANQIARYLRQACLCILLSIVMRGSFSIAADQAPFCKIVVKEKGTGWPVPLVELRTVHQVRFVTDNAGVIAFDLPELMGQEVWFDILGHGYELPADMFGYRGVRLVPKPGKTLEVEVERKIIAKRIGRLTGTGLFAESQKLGLERDWRDAGIVGCDSVQNSIYQGKLFWAWGDSSVAKYPLGIFDCSGATTALQPLKSFEPPLRMPYDYFHDEKGNPRGVAKMPGEGPTWIFGMVTLPDRTGEPKLVCCYNKIKGFLEQYEAGLCVWNDKESRFDRLTVVWTKSEGQPKPPIMPDGHAVIWKDESRREWALFGNPFPRLKCPATFEGLQDTKQWEVLKPQEQVSSADDGKGVVPHTGSIAWNEHRRRWVTIFMQRQGSPSALGELWYAEANSPLGPWGSAVKVLSHDNYTFYNPRIHTEFAPASSEFLFFEGTYTQMFADRPQPTPRYEYNQILYRLDLSDSRLERSH